MGRRTNLNDNERYLIHIDLAHGVKPSQIALKLGRHRSCITKEIKLNIDPAYKEYNHLVATNMAKKRMSESKKRLGKINKIPQIIMDDVFNDYMGIRKLGVEESVVTLRKEYGYRVSYASLYRHIEKNRNEGGKLYKFLTRKGKRSRRKSKIVRVSINDKVSIEVRPDKAVLMTEAGHYEIDTIYGKDQESFLLTIVDIATLYTVIIKLENKEAKTVEKALTEFFENSLLPLKSITSDNGGEFACHKIIKNKFNIEWYFCHPYCSWERGLNENTNGLIRRHLPKGTDFNKVDDKFIRMVQVILNNRYRKRIGYKTPKDLMVEMIQQAA